MNISSYFVETHEYNTNTVLCIQVEYAHYETATSDWAYKAELGCLHDTILTLGVF